MSEVSSPQTKAPAPSRISQLKREIAAEDLVSQQAQLLRLGNGDLQAVDGQGIFGPAVDVALGGPDGVGADGHALQHRVGVALQDAPVHEGPGVAFVGVADDVFLIGLVFGGEFPFHPGGEAGPAPAPEA